MSKTPKRVDCCPKCGSTEGFYTLSVYRNVRIEIGFDGIERDNSDAFDGCNVEGGGYAYCVECNYKIGRTSTILKRNGIEL